MAMPASALIIASLFVVLVATPAIAQEAQPLARLPELRVIAPPFEAAPLPRSWVPARVEILTDAEIQALRPSVLPQALERLGKLLEGYLNYAYTRATFQDRADLATPLPPGVETVQPGDSLAMVPRHRINLGAAYHPWPGATLSLDVRHVGSQFLRGDEVNRQPALPGSWVAGLSASAKVKRLEVFVRLNNVLDNRYETFGTFAVNGLAARDSLWSAFSLRPRRSISWRGSGTRSRAAASNRPRGAKSGLTRAERGR